MKRDVSQLTETEFDLVIIGGGIFAACSAWDASLRGLSVALIEKEDFCSGVSANSFKFIHGGIRYLQHGDIIRLRSSCRERSAMLRVAPHLVRPMPVLIPTYGHGKSGKAFLGIGMLLYDLLTLSRNRGIRDPKRRIPWTKFFNKQDVLKEYPDLEQKNLTGAAMFHDAQMYNPTRLVLSFIKSAVAKGAVVANYVEAKDLLTEGNRVTGVKALDRRAGREIEIRGRSVLNAAGPWSDWILQAALPEKGIDRGVYSRDACFVVKRRFNSRRAIAVQGRTSDPDALLSRPARHLFLVPWRDYTLVGVWHVVWERSPDLVTVKEDEVGSFIEEINWAYPGLNLSLDDVQIWNAGLVPFGANEEGAENLSYGKRSTFIDHATSENIEGLVTLIGVRYTTARGDSAKAIDLICSKLGVGKRKAATESIPVEGGDITDFDKFAGGLYREQTLGLSEASVRALVHNHGTKALDIMKMAALDDTLAQTIGNSSVIKAEVVHAIENEMAFTLADIVFRRTDLATGGNPGDKALRECAELAARYTGWDNEELGAQLDAVKSRFPAWVS